METVRSLAIRYTVYYVRSLKIMTAYPIMSQGPSKGRGDMGKSGSFGTVMHSLVYGSLSMAPAAYLGMLRSVTGGSP